MLLVGQLVVFGDERGPHFFRHVVDDGSFGVVEHGIVEGKKDVGPESFDGDVVPTIEALLDGAQVHGPLDDIEVVRQTKLDRIDGKEEDPTVLMSQEIPQKTTSLDEELKRRQPRQAPRGSELPFERVDKHIQVGAIGGPSVTSPPTSTLAEARPRCSRGYQNSARDGCRRRQRPG